MKRIILIILTVVVILTGNVSCQKANDIDNNPLSMVTLSIVPDFDDGTVREPSTVEALGMKSNFIFLDVAVTPAKYAEILSDTARFIHNAVFSPVRTKSEFGRAFTVSSKKVTYAAGAPIPFLEAYFELDDETAEVLMNKNTPYTVSYSIEDKDGVHGAATSFVTISHEKVTEPEVTDGLSVTKEYTCECGAKYSVTCKDPNILGRGFRGWIYVTDPKGLPWIVKDSAGENVPYYEDGSKMYFICTCGKKSKEFSNKEFRTQDQ